MSTSYFFKICRKADGKAIAKFNFDRIKALNDVYGKKLILDPEDIPYVSDNRDKEKKFSITDIDADVEVLESLELELESDFYTKKLLLIPNAKSVDIKNEFEQDLIDKKDDILNVRCAISALKGLRMVIENVTEDAVDVTGDTPDEELMAYQYNAKGLPKTSEGYDPYIWVNDVDIFAYAC